MHGEDINGVDRGGWCLASPSVSVRASQRTLAGRQFAPVSEAAMLPGLLSLAATFRTSHEEDLVAIPEFIGPYGIADLAVVITRGELLSRRLAAGVRPLLYEPDVDVIHALAARRPRSPSEVAERLGWSTEAVASRLRRLGRYDAVERTAGGRYIRHPDLVAVGRLHVLEAKVRDWRRAREQARRYQLWSDTASVVLARQPVTVQRATEFTRWRLGFAVRDTWIRRPQMYRRSPSKRLLTSELIIAALTTGSGEMRRSPALP